MFFYFQALTFFQQATSAQPDDVGAHINVGRTLNHLERYSEAESAYLKAKSLLPQPKPGQRYVTRIAPQHLSVFLNLGNLMAKDPGRLEEADLLYRQAIAMRNDYVQVSKIKINKESLSKLGHRMLREVQTLNVVLNLSVVMWYLVFFSKIWLPH